MVLARGLQLLGATLLAVVAPVAVESAGANQRQPASAAPAFVLHIPAVQVRFIISGQLWVAQLPGDPSGDLWLNGPLVLEYRSIVSPTDPAGSPHEFLRVYFDVRAYKDGPVRLDVTVENTLDTAKASTVEYDVEIKAGDKTLFQMQHVAHFYLTRWRKVLACGEQPAGVIPDISTFSKVRALPPYMSEAPNRLLSTQGPTFAILGWGDLNEDMPAHGGRPELAPYPNWTASYLVGRKSGQLSYVLRNGDLAGSWPIHVRELADGSLVSIDRRPNFWFDQRGGDKPQGTPLPPWPYSRTPVFPQSPLIPDTPHVPSLAYVPYLLTGDRYYADEMAFWADYVLLSTYQDVTNHRREGSKGLLYSQEVRGFAWGLRNLADAAAYLPDGDPMKPYLADKIANNLAWLDEQVRTKTGPLGVAWIILPWSLQEISHKLIVSLWQYNYLAWAIDHTNDQGFAGGVSFRDQVARFQLSLFTSPDWKRRENACPYRVCIGDVAGQEVRYYSSLKEAYEKTFSNHDLVRPLRGQYGVDGRLMLLIALKNGWSEAAEPLQWLDGRIAQDFPARPGWAIAPPQREEADSSRKDQKSLGHAPTYYLGKGWSTFGIALPRGLCRAQLSVGDSPTQTDVKTRWPDGTIRFAVVSTVCSREGLFPILEANP
jgi:hypothetical protein